MKSSLPPSPICPKHFMKSNLDGPPMVLKGSAPERLRLRISHRACSRTSTLPGIGMSARLAILGGGRTTPFLRSALR